jgi:hypothetical protein
VKYLFEHLEQLAVWGDILQMAVLELIRIVSGGAAQLAVRCMAKQLTAAHTPVRRHHRSAAVR